jgi:anti-sigma factor ChrR (cupin superfamily)
MESSSDRKTDQPMIVRHLDECPWETIRWPGETGKMVFHPRPENPTEPNAGVLRLEPGAYHPRHRHDFAQVWHILEGVFTIGGRQCGPGTVIYHPDPHYEDEFRTETGGQIFICQYPGPTTGGRPIYDGRFNMSERKSVGEERTDV